MGFPGSRKRTVQCFRRFGAGVRGKFYAEDIKVAEKKFRETLRPLGAPKIRVLRLAGPPLILPISSISFTASTAMCEWRPSSVFSVLAVSASILRSGTIFVIFATVKLFDKILARIPARLIA